MKYILIALPFIIGFILIAMRRSRYTEIERKIYADSLKETEAWRKSITTETLVKHNGIVYHVLSVGNGKAVISNHNDEFSVNVSDLWPVE